MPELSLQQAWEALAVVLAVTYLVLAIRQNIWCWAAAAVSASLYLVILYDSKLYLQSALQMYYLAMAAYGWYHWRNPGDPARDLPVSRWPLRNHAIAIGIVLLLMAVSTQLMLRYSDAPMPHLDSFTTWGSVVTTFLVARKVLENWLYWFVIDVVSIFMFLGRELYFTTGLFFLYLIMIVIGYRSWRASMAKQAA